MEDLKKHLLETIENYMEGIEMEREDIVEKLGDLNHYSLTQLEFLTDHFIETLKYRKLELEFLRELQNVCKKYEEKVNK